MKKITVALALAMLALCARAKDVEFDSERALDKAQYRTELIKMKYCFRDTARTLLIGGMRDYWQIMSIMHEGCTQEFIWVSKMKQPSTTEEQRKVAAIMILKLSDYELKQAMKEGQ